MMIVEAMTSYGWSWVGPPHQGEQVWDLTVAAWRDLIYVKPTSEQKFNERWDRQDTTEQWEARWKKLWNGKATARTKTRIWRFIRRGYFTNSKAREWGKGDGLCTRCSLEVETFDHAIWTCPRLRHRTAWASWLLVPEELRSTSLVGAEDFITVLDNALDRHKTNHAATLLLLTILRENWNERNVAQFMGKSKTQPETRIINQANEEIQATMAGRNLTRGTNEAAQRAEQTLQYWRNETTRWNAGHTTRTRQPPFQITPITPAIAADDPPLQPSTNSQAPWTTEQMIQWSHEERSRGDPEHPLNALYTRMNNRERRTRERQEDDVPMEDHQVRQLVNDLQPLLDTWRIDQPDSTHHQLVTFENVQGLVDHLANITRD
ncbi:hypothetical protein R1sor_012898 [Riccia sorocarpa]|uniref:Reverse transcriptase zinc-binding domain-containing protein n=1 Tax=Riccia sorocarpa TaxID=122646 RepID=A0ABD3I513_9MARC